MGKVKFFEADDQIISFYLSEIGKDLIILIEEPYTKKKDVVMTFSQETAIEMANEILSVLSDMNNLKVEVEFIDR